MSSESLRILLVGESWISYGIHIKGFSSYTTGSYAEGLAPLRDALTGSGHKFSYIRNHEASEQFPRTLADLSAYDVIIFSDLPADTLLLHDDTFIRGQRTPNRLGLINEWVADGGGFLMIGGYMSFSGFGGKANYHFSPLAKILPVKMFGYDDRVEVPEGVIPVVELAGHVILQGISRDWPFFLGYNKLLPGEGQILMSCQGDPFLTVRSEGKGRVAAFASDCSPHWAPDEFINWPDYPVFWDRLVRWLAGKLS